MTRSISTSLQRPHAADAAELISSNHVRRIDVGHDAIKQFSPARRYASAATSYGPVSVCLSVCLSVTSRCSIETAERIELALIRELRSTGPALCLKEILVYPKIRVLPSETLKILPRHIDPPNMLST